MVVSSPITGAAIIGGELILSLADGGQIINCGLVQGPPGPKGSVGSPGPKGDAGLDGCTLLHGPGFPDPGLGKSGDFYWMVSPEVGVFGPKTAGGWGSPVILSRPITASKADYKPIAGQSGGGGSTGDGSGPSKVYTNQVIPTGSGRLKSKNNKTTVEYFGSPNGILAPSGPLNSQANINGWIVKALEELDAVVPVAIVDSLPAAGEYTGDLVLFEGSLYIWAETEWIAVSGQGGAILSETAPVADTEDGALWFCTAPDDLTLYVYDGAVWVPASPPVSLDGIESAVANIDEQLLKVNANVAMNKRDIDEAVLDVREDQDRQDRRLDVLEAQDQGGDFLPTAGGELKGTLEINGSRDKDSKINPLLCRADGYYMSFGVNKDGEVFAGSSESQPFMAETNWHVVTKGYLDSQASRHFGSPYRFRSHGIATNLTEGEFTYDKNWNWYAHRYDAAGGRIGISKEDGYTHDGMFKVYRYNGSIDLICIMHRYDVCKTGQKNTNYFEWRNKESPYTHVEWLEESKIYYLSDGFLLPQ